MYDGVDFSKTRTMEPKSPDLLPLEENIRQLNAQVWELASQYQGDTHSLLMLLRALETLHRQIRIELFEPTLPNTRQALYQLLRDIEEEGGWPYIERMRLAKVMQHFFPERAPKNDSPPLPPND